MESENSTPEEEQTPIDAETSQPKREKVYKDDEELDDTIFIRNVSRFETTQESLKAHMETNWGDTVHCLLCKDRETGESKGTAFVKFKDPESAGMCLGDFEDREMQQKFFLDGRNLFVLPALNRNQMGEVKKASAKKNEVSEEKKKNKKPRWYRTAKKQDPNDAAPDTHKKSNSHAKGSNSKPDKHSKKGNQTNGGRKPTARKGPPSKGRKGPGKPGQNRKPESNRRPNKNKMASSKKVKKTKKTKRKA